MDTEQFVNHVHRLHPRQAATLRFFEDGLTGLYRLQNLLERHPTVRLDDYGKAIMMVVMLSRDWGGARNRSYLVHNLASAGEDYNLLISLARDIETIEVADHEAKGLMSRRQKIREGAVEKLVGNIVTPDFRKEIEGWGLTIKTGFLELGGLPLLRFFIRYGEDTITSVGIDGWSGRIMIGSNFGDWFYCTPDQVQHLLRSETEHLLERLTA